MAPDYVIKFQNFSDVEFERVDYGYPTFSEGPVRDTTIPSDTLKATGGLETLAWEVFLQDVSSGPYDGWVTWRDKKNGYVFGVNIHIPVQIFHIGTSPYYQVKYWNAKGEGKQDHYKPVDEPGTTWSFPDEWSKASGLNVRIDPDAGGQKFTASVLISKRSN